MTEKQALENIILLYNQIQASLTGHQTKLIEMSILVLQEKINPQPPEPVKEEKDVEPS